MTGCTSPPVATAFDAKWEFVDTVPGQPTMACLREDDVDKLREILIRCEAGDK